MLITPQGFESRIDDDDTGGTGRWYIVNGGRLLVTRGDAPQLPWDGSRPAELAERHVVHCFGHYGGHACRVLVIDDASAIDAGEGSGLEWRGLRSLFGALPDADVGLAGRALQLAEWTRTHRHCGCCGAPMRRQPGERAMQCAQCNFTAYPRIAPAMMVLVRNGPRILLARAAHFQPGVYSALAGFVEAGESLEECVHREVAEEVGIAITNLRYFRSQSWPFPHSLMLAFVADYAGGELAPDPAELTDAQWFELDQLPKLPSPISISRALIEHVVGDMRAEAGR